MRIAHVVASGTAKYAQQIRSGRHHLTSDEPKSGGGTDTGPAPYGLLLASLAACTSITLRMYAERKGWDLGEISVELDFEKDEGKESIRREVRFSVRVTEEQRARLAEIAEKTPVTKTIRQGVPIETTVHSSE